MLCLPSLLLTIQSLKRGGRDWWRREGLLIILAVCGGLIICGHVHAGGSKYNDLKFRQYIQLIAKREGNKPTATITEIAGLVPKSKSIKEFVLGNGLAWVDGKDCGESIFSAKDKLKLTKNAGLAFAPDGAEILNRLLETCLTLELNVWPSVMESFEKSDLAAVYVKLDRGFQDYLQEERNRETEESGSSHPPGGQQRREDYQSWSEAPQYQEYQEYQDPVIGGSGQNQATTHESAASYPPPSRPSAPPLPSYLSGQLPVNAPPPLPGQPPSYNSAYYPQQQAGIAGTVPVVNKTPLQQTLPGGFDVNTMIGGVVAQVRQQKAQQTYNHSVAQGSHHSAEWTLTSMQPILQVPAGNFFGLLDGSANWTIIAEAWLAIGGSEHTVLRLYETRDLGARRSILTGALNTKAGMAANLLIKLADVAHNHNLRQQLQLQLQQNRPDPFLSSVENHLRAAGFSIEEVAKIGGDNFKTRADIASWTMQAAGFLKNNCKSLDVGFKNVVGFFDYFGLVLNQSVHTLEKFINLAQLTQDDQGEKLLADVIVALSQAQRNAISYDDPLSITMDGILQAGVQQAVSGGRPPLDEIDLKNTVQDVLAEYGTPVEQVCIAINTNGGINPIRSSKYKKLSTTVGPAVVRLNAGHKRTLMTLRSAPDLNNDALLGRVAEQLLPFKWKQLARSMGLPDNDLQQIETAFSKDLNQQKLEALKSLRAQAVSEEVYSDELAQALDQHGMKRVRQMFWEKSQ